MRLSLSIAPNTLGSLYFFFFKNTPLLRIRWYTKKQRERERWKRDDFVEAGIFGSEWKTAMVYMSCHDLAVSAIKVQRCRDTRLCRHCKSVASSASTQQRVRTFFNLNFQKCKCKSYLRSLMHTVWPIVSA